MDANLNWTSIHETLLFHIYIYVDNNSSQRSNIVSISCYFEGHPLRASAGSPGPPRSTTHTPAEGAAAWWSTTHQAVQLMDVSISPPGVVERHSKATGSTTSSDYLAAPRKAKVRQRQNSRPGQRQNSHASPVSSRAVF